MTVWRTWKNKQGSRRADGLYLRRAWGWYPHLRAPSEKGWDLMKSLDVLGTYPDQPLADVVAAVDKMLPLGKEHPLEAMRYSYYSCPHCEKSTVFEGQPVFRATATCGLCAKTYYGYIRATWSRQLELLPGQKISSFDECYLWATT